MKKRSRLIKALDNRFYVKFMQLEIALLSSAWEKQFLEVLDRHAPLRARKVCNSYAPYIDNQLRRNTFLRDSYKKRCTDNKNIDDRNAYKTLKKRG